MDYPITIALPRPIAFSGGNAATLFFKRLTLLDMMTLTEKGDALSSEVASMYGVLFGQAEDKDGRRFGLIEADITDNLSPAPALACASALIQSRDYKADLGDGELVPKEPIVSGEEAVIKLAHPIKLEFTVGADNQAFNLEWLTFKAQKYSETVEFVKSYVSGDVKTAGLFIRAFATMMNVPEGYPLKRMTETQVDTMDASDVERIAALVMPDFIEWPV